MIDVEDAGVGPSGVVRVGRRIAAVVHAVANMGTIAATIPLLLIMCLVTLDALGRYGLHRSIKGIADVVELFMLFVVFLATASVAARKEHVTVDLATSRYPAGVQTIARCASSFGSLMIVVFMAWQLGARGWSQMLNPTRVTDTLEVPIGPFLMVASLGCSLLALVLAVDCCRYWGQAFSGKPRE